MTQEEANIKAHDRWDTFGLSFAEEVQPFDGSDSMFEVGFGALLKGSGKSWEAASLPMLTDGLQV